MSLIKSKAQLNWVIQVGRVLNQQLEAAVAECSHHDNNSVICMLYRFLPLKIHVYYAEIFSNVFHSGGFGVLGFWGFVTRKQG